MRIVRRTAASAVIAAAALLWANTSARAAGVLDQVPQDAFVVVKVSNLEQTSKKIARWAEQLGLSQFVPQFADPLGTIEKELNITQGLDRTGEMAFVFVDPKSVNGKEDDAMIVLAPTKDFAAFTANFKDKELKPGANGVSSFKDKDKEVHVAQWGNYAAMGPSVARIGKKPAAGLKLSGLASRSGNEQDILLYANIPALRELALPKLEEARGEMTKEFDRALDGNAAGPEAEMAKKFAPVIKVLGNQYINGAKAFLTDAEGAFIGLSLSDVGLNATVAADFKPGSYMGNLAAKTKNTNQDLMAGLPQRKYFAYGGATLTKETVATLFNDIAGPVVKELASNPDGKAFAEAIDAAKGSMGAVDSVAFGYTVPTGALGADSVIQSVSVFKGDSKTIADAQAKVMAGIGKLMGAAGGADPNAPKMEFEQTPGGKTVGGVKLDTYKLNITMDENNPQSAQMQQMMGFIYGPNGMGGTYGAIDPKTFIVVQGGTDKLITDTVASAKAGADPLSKQESIMAVTKRLPSERFAVEYVDLAQVVSSAVKYAQGFGMPVKMQLPQNLPPIGMSASTAGPAVRFDVHVPTSLIQSLVAAGMQTYMEVQGGGAGGAGGQPDGL